MDKLTNHPLPILQPTTPHAFPLALTASGKISAGYSQGTVNQVAPNVDVKTKIMLAAAMPYRPAAAVSPAASALRPSLEKPPPRNIAMPWTTEPQYSVYRRPIRSSVKTQIRVENCESALDRVGTSYVPCRRCCSAR